MVASDSPPSLLRASSSLDSQATLSVRTELQEVGQQESFHKGSGREHILSLNTGVFSEDLPIGARARLIVAAELVLMKSASWITDRLKNLTVQISVRHSEEHLVQ